ncbi:MAG: NAD(P)(+) transhydrogenase (Re/Si-specific) subunit beta [Alphaproteobacteria bacterium]|nr:NAD(P)(+) transhydrogenase (Re/Si-specific) subunit beta [Alphaproteobacteria bacterium]
MDNSIFDLLYLLSALCFILALKGLASPLSARFGNYVGMVGMALAIGTTLFAFHITNFTLILTALISGGLIGLIMAWRISMTALPQLVAAFHSLIGLSAVCVALVAFYRPDQFGIGRIGYLSSASLIEMGLGSIVGAITFSGSLIAFGKLQALLSSAPLLFKKQQWVNIVLFVILIGLFVLFVSSQNQFVFWGLIFLSFALGFLLVLPVGGADMPVVVSMLNSYSGWAASGIGFTLHNNLLIITGALVGASGAILSYVMCKAMNRSIFNVLFAAFSTGDTTQNKQIAEARPIKTGNAEDAAFLMGNASSIIIVPGYGMAVAQAQHVLKELADLLKNKNIDVRYAIHPVAGRMPGHMNVLLAEANVPYDDVLELDEINRDFSTTDIALVIGANDITNPAAKNDKQSPIYGMPILNVGDAQTVLFIKRSMASGYAGIENDLFFQNNTMMLFGDAKKVCEDIIKAL